jgi:hypothetical protein
VVVVLAVLGLVVVTENKLALELVAVYTAAVVLLAGQILMLVAVHTTTAQEALMVLFVLFGLPQIVHFHQLTQAICNLNETLHSN